MGKGCWGLIFILSIAFCTFVFELIVVTVDLLVIYQSRTFLYSYPEPVLFSVSLACASVPSQIEQIAHLNDECHLFMSGCTFVRCDH